MADLNPESAQKLAADLVRGNEREKARLARIARYVRGDHDLVDQPAGTHREYQWMRDRAAYNLMRLTVSVIAQNLYVDGYRREGEDNDTDAWQIWQANRFDQFQHGIHRAALQFGYSYAVSLPGQMETAAGTQKMPALRPVSPRNMVAVYEDHILDEWPQYAVETAYGKTATGDLVQVMLYDSNQIFYFTSADSDLTELKFSRNETHETGYCPVVKYKDIIDLDGDSVGQIEPLMVLQDQINFITYNLMMAQQFAAFPQRWVAGMLPGDANGASEQPWRPRIDAMMAVSDPNAKFGQFAAADLQGYLSAREETLRGMAIIAQLPPYQFLGTDDLASAEALAAARDGLDRVVNERQSNFGESHEQLLRVASLQRGDQAGWDDRTAQVNWRDTSTRAFAATVDALVKLQTLGVPNQALWEKIPGVTKQDVDRWDEMAKEQPDQTQALLNRLDAQNQAVTQTSGNANDNRNPALQ